MESLTPNEEKMLKDIYPAGLGDWVWGRDLQQDPVALRSLVKRQVIWPFRYDPETPEIEPKRDYWGVSFGFVFQISLNGLLLCNKRFPGLPDRVDRKGLMAQRKPLGDAKE